MSQSDEIKNFLEHKYKNTSAKDWKRVSKKQNIREFINSKTGQEITVIGEDESFFVLEKNDKMTYAINDFPDVFDNSVMATCVSFNSQSFWDKNGYLYDQHVGHVLEALGVPSEFAVSEAMENCFAFSIGSKYHSRDAIHNLLQPLGFVHNTKMETWLQCR